MAWNPSPKVAHCREASRQWGANKVVTLLVNEDAGTMEVVSYGRTRRECDEAKRLADAIYDAAYSHMAATPAPEAPEREEGE